MDLPESAIQAICPYARNQLPTHNNFDQGLFPNFTFRFLAID